MNPEESQKVIKLQNELNAARQALDAIQHMANFPEEYINQMRDVPLEDRWRWFMLRAGHVASQMINRIRESQTLPKGRLWYPYDAESDLKDARNGDTLAQLRLEQWGIVWEGTDTREEGMDAILDVPDWLKDWHKHGDVNV